MKIVFTDAQTVSVGDLSLSNFDKYGKVVTYPLLTAGEAAEALIDADAVICNKTPMNESTLKNCKNLKYIGVLATGVNNVDLPYATKRGITVTNAGNYSTDSVAQHVFSLILQVYSGVGFLNDYTAKGEWQKSKVFSPLIYPIRQLAGKTLGLVGYGNIGKAVAKLGKAFGMNVKVFTRTSPTTVKDVTFTDFPSLLAESVIISGHCPLTADTEKLFNEAAFAGCKKDLLFVNTARGGIVDETALATALKSGTIGAAALDVLTTEPMAVDCPLIGAPNLIITPHVAWTPLETRKALLEISADNLESFILGKPKNKVN